MSAVQEPPRLLADLKSLCLGRTAQHWRRLAETAAK